MEVFLQLRELVNETGMYVGPSMDRLATARRRVQQKEAPKTDPCGGFEEEGAKHQNTQTEKHWKRLKEEPNAMVDNQGKPLPFSILAQEMVVDSHDWDWYGAQTKRATTRRRANINFYKRRVFWDTMETLCT